MRRDSDQPSLFDTTGDEPPYDLCITIDYVGAQIVLEWTKAQTEAVVARLVIFCTGLKELTWDIRLPAGQPPRKCAAHRTAIRAQLNDFKARFPANPSQITLGMIPSDPEAVGARPGDWVPLALPAHLSAWAWLEFHIMNMARQLSIGRGPLGGALDQFIAQLNATGIGRELRREHRRIEKEEALRAERAERVREAQRRRQEAERRRAQSKAAARARGVSKESIAPLPAAARPPLPPVAVRFEPPAWQVQETLLPLADLRDYFIRERAALWWVSNQSDDLLSLPHCHLERLEYQIRTALRVIGPLRGRALLSDEVGLGKTIEAGLVIKEYLTRGLIKRFLVLTVPSLVDQWAEELLEKFDLPSATTNQAAFRSDPAAFWQREMGIVASLHTLKQPGHLAVAQALHWDMLVIDEAHYLRNRASQAWQAVNALPRQFLLLLTATPVQNSLEELYNLVTLLQPGQFPSPKEFRDRYLDPKRPHQPKEPEELRRLLGQVMIRNTRANAGVSLPPRRAETVLFEPEEVEREFWARWESELRAELSRLAASQSSLWGRLLLQTAGSSPAAWMEVLRSFPGKSTAQRWLEQARWRGCWDEKCRLLAPLTQGEGGVVVFSQFVQTQAALAEYLRSQQIPVWFIHGQTPAAQRQPITEDFRRQGGALLLTHSGTEGRNLQFCRRLVNFDLPWNPMEIEQRIGRLHRIGQKHPVRIYNFVQTRSLQEHLLQLLQEKLNLFELVVGETGLILGERYSSDEFAEEIFRRWRDHEGRVAESFQALGEELTAARERYDQVKELDETLFAKDYESL